MLPNTSIRLNINRTYGRSEEDDKFPIIEEFLSNLGKPQAWQQTGSSNKQITGESKGYLEGAAKNDDNNVANPERNKGTNKNIYISFTRRQR